MERIVVVKDGAVRRPDREARLIMMDAALAPGVRMIRVRRLGIELLGLTIGESKGFAARIKAGILRA